MAKVPEFQTVWDIIRSDMSEEDKLNIIKELDWEQIDVLNNNGWGSILDILIDSRCPKLKKYIINHPSMNINKIIYAYGYVTTYLRMTVTTQSHYSIKLILAHPDFNISYEEIIEILNHVKHCRNTKNEHGITHWDEICDMIEKYIDDNFNLDDSNKINL